MIVLLILLLVLALCVLLWLWAIAPQLPRADFSAFLKYDYAHRGLHDKDNGVPENSLKAFSLAAVCGFGMELDLQLTKDNRVVVHHDDSILRTCGVDKRISQMTWEELSGYKLTGSQEGVPLFSQTLEAVGGRTPLIIELKGYNDPALLCRLAMEELQGYQGLYCVESFDPRIVRWFKLHHPEIVRGQLMEKMKAGDNGLSGAQAFFARNMMTNFLTRPHFEAYDFHARDIPSLHAARRVFGMQEVSWTIRTQEDYKKAKALGNLCIFEKFLPAAAAQEEKVSFRELLSAAGRGAVCSSAVKSEK